MAKKKLLMGGLCVFLLCCRPANAIEGVQVGQIGCAVFKVLATLFADQGKQFYDLDSLQSSARLRLLSKIAEGVEKWLDHPAFRNMISKGGDHRCCQECLGKLRCRMQVGADGIAARGTEGPFCRTLFDPADCQPFRP